MSSLLLCSSCTSDQDSLEIHILLFSSSSVAFRIVLFYYVVKCSSNIIVDQTHYSFNVSSVPVRVSVHVGTLLPTCCKEWPEQIWRNGMLVKPEKVLIILNWFL